MPAPPARPDSLDADFDDLERKLAKRDLEELKRRNRRRLLSFGIALLIIGAVILVFSLVLKDSPCVDLLEATKSKRLDDGAFRKDTHLEPGVCHVTLSSPDRAPKFRIHAMAGRSDSGSEFAELTLRQRPFERFEPLGLGEHGFIAIAKPRASSSRTALSQLPTWLSAEGGDPTMHVAVFQKDDVVVTVELDPHTFDADESVEIVESMKPALSELRRLAPR
ncbi:MAG: hypothetical protein HOW73_13130 [Polyangiaceae bacterium]|nr:hypothetical protein [Polyangiaceae bacterium]